MNKQNVDHRLLLFSGFFALIVAMGVGRFVYTPLLPQMQEQFGFSDEIAGLTASVNYLGYLFGALLCFKNMTIKTKLLLFRTALVLSVATTAWMGFVTQINWWITIRFLSGIASACIFIIGSSIIMERLSQSKYSHLSVLIYSGVGAGIALSGILSAVLIHYFDVQISWIVFAMICIPLVYFCWVQMIPSESKIPIDSKSEDGVDFEYPGLLPWLTAAYFCEGFGYIVSGTFIVSFLQNQSGFLSSGPFAWTMVGLTASISVPIFYQMSKKIQIVKVLILAHFLQGIGIIIPVLSSHWIGINLGAILFGGTFMGITALSLSVGKILKPGRSQMVIGLLTSVYGVGQIIGPLVSGFLSEHTGNIETALVMSSIVVFFGGFILIAGTFKKLKHK